MQRITIGRYGNIPNDVPRPENFVPAQDAYAGWVEGVRDDNSEWIMLLDGQGNPAVYWATRAEDGSVVGDPVILEPGSVVAGPQD